MEKLKTLYEKLVKAFKWLMAFSKKQCLNYIMNMAELSEEEFNILERAYFKHETLRRLKNNEISRVIKEAAPGSQK